MISRRVRSLFGAAAVAACAAAGSLLVQLGEHPDPVAAHELAWARKHLHGARLAAFLKGDDRASFRSVVANRGEDRGEEGVEAERYALRAYPLDEIPFELTLNARASFDKLRLRSNRGNRTAGVWQLLGPEYAIEPAILSFSGVAYVASGRVTALVVGPTCTPSRCRLWVGAAGGGIWRTDDALAGSPHWALKSNGLTSNAIGVLVADPRDPSGNTLYAGTGEPNASADSAAGTGVFRTTDGGETWNLLPGSAPFYGRAISAVVLHPTDPDVLYVGITRGVRGVSSVSGGSTSNPPVAAAFGLYKSTDGGASFSLIWDGAGSIRGVSDVELDPRDPETIYAAAFQRGIYRSSPRLDGTANFLQVFAPGSPTQNTDRTELAVTVKDGKTRIYAGDGAVGPGPGRKHSAVWRVDDADQPAAALLASQAAPGGWEDLTTTTNGDPRYATFDYCSGQCWYDNDIATPAGRPDEVWVLGSYQYGEIGGRSNGRAVVRSTTAGDPDPAHGDRTFTDMTWDAQPAPDLLHPDSQAIAFHPTNPDIVFLGSDGGVVRTSGEYVDVSRRCETRPIVPASVETCKRMLSAVPSRLINMNKGLATLQFQSVSVNPNDPDGELIGGTQDNGTWHYKGSSRTWHKVMYGDGGNSGIDAGNGAIFVNTFTGRSTDTSFRSGRPDSWVVTSGPLFASGEGALFYPAVLLDPVVGGTQFIGLQHHIFRTKANGGDRDYLEANCPEFFTSAANPACGDWVPLGGPAGANQSGALIGTAYGTDRLGGSVGAVARTGSDSSTLWAATTAGRVFVSKNADAEPASAVAFDRIDDSASNDPERFVSAIVIDPADPNHAWIAYSGYSAATPARPGHVFEVVYDPGTGTATWSDLDPTDGIAGGDLPVTALARDDVTGDLYAGTDFGVARLPFGATAWEEAGSGLPVVQVSGLSVLPGARRLYAATHGMSIWTMPLP